MNKKKTNVYAKYTSKTRKIVTQVTDSCGRTKSLFLQAYQGQHKNIELMENSIFQTINPKKFSLID